jgi:hypothetical protein
MINRFTYYFFIICFIITAFIGCDNKSQDTQLNEANAEMSKLVSENKKLQDQHNELIQKQEALLRNHKELEEWTQKLVDGYGPGVWYMDESTRPVFIKPVLSGDLKEITKELNLKFKQDGLPLITLIKTKGNAAYVTINDGNLLAQRMGTHGAISYMNAVTYSLASVHQINCVSFEFQEGDHAIPGKYCK